MEKIRKVKRVENNTIERKKQQLKAYIQDKKKLKSLNQQKAELEEKIKSVKAILYSDMPKGSTKKTDLSDYMVKLERMDERIDDKIKNINDGFLNIEEAISGLGDGDESEIIRMRYIEGKKWEEISKKTEYTTRQVHNIHGKALKNIEI